MITLDPKTTALVLIDLQNGILSNALTPLPADGLLAGGKALAERFRAAGAAVVLVNVSFSADGGDRPSQNVDMPMPIPSGGFPAEWVALAAGLAQPGDIRITKRQWGAFYGTELELQLRRRGIKTIVLGGVATQAGVESTARQAWELGYDVVTVTDVLTSGIQEAHDASLRFILPRISRLSDSAAIAFAA